MAATPLQDEWIARVLGVETGAPEDGPEAPADLRRWQAVKATWARASDAADGQIAGLQAALRASDDPEYREIAELGLNGVTGNFKVPLLAALRDIDGSGGRPDAGAVRRLRGIVAGFINHLASDPRVDAVDDNELGVRVDIAGTLIPALEAMDEALAILARPAA